MQYFDHRGYRIAYQEWGAGERVLVLTHGLLMNSHMYDRLGPAIAKRGYRVVALDMLGHGASDRPLEHGVHSMTLYGEVLASLLDHLELDDAVIGGTSLGANVSLEMAVRYPDRVRGLFIEMPVLDDALVAVALCFTPVIASLHFGRRPAKALSAVARRIPRGNHLIDIGLDWIRQDPEPSLSVLKGLLLGRTCPPRAERERIDAPTMIIGHPNDPLHPFSDADALAREVLGARLVDANSILEWRLRPERLNRELESFLRAVWDGPRAREGSFSPS